jgi:hypothetical protein
MMETPVLESDTTGVAGREGVPGRRTPKPRPRLTDASPAPRPQRPGRLLKWLAWSLIAIGSAGLSWFYVEWQGRHAAVAASALHLQVELERTGDGLLLRWEPGAVPEGAQTLLDIQDGGRAEQALLDPEVARLGAVTYQPESEDLRFKLTIKDAKDGRIFAQDAAAVAYARPDAGPRVRER